MSEVFIHEERLGLTHAATCQEPELESQHVRKLIRRCLERCAAIRRDKLLDGIGVCHTVAMRELGGMVERGEVEVIRPLSAAIAAERTCYRLLRETDNDFLWEQWQMVPSPVGRMEDVRDRERRGPEAFRGSIRDGMVTGVA